MSLIDSANLLAQEIKYEQQLNCPPSAQREFAIAITAIEEASMRIARGIFLKAGIVATPEDVAKATLEKAEQSVHPDQLQFVAESSALAGLA